MVRNEQVTQDNQKFNVLIYLTDGVITDLQKTIDQIVQCSGLPAAIIIIGVGDADFSTMEQLDADDEALYSSTFRKYMEADVVQFVPFNDYKANPHMLAKEVLMELPGQLLSWMRKNDI